MEGRNRIADVACRRACATNSNCTHWAWGPFGGGTCFMKQNGISKNMATFNRDFKCGLKAEAIVFRAGANGEESDNCDFPYRNLVNFESNTAIVQSSAARCSAVCVANARCNSWVWETRENGSGNCHLKGNVGSRSLANFRRGFRCGIPPRAL